MEKPHRNGARAGLIPRQLLKFQPLNASFNIGTCLANAMWAHSVRA
jgi:hypothetical protein